ncbi:hypothetical protein OF83DRAFT_419755 [Amylostereum chailletii]|nr:hypothetical protein OF83DRAFT_419755 [Amylostereum chailletii]
MGSIPPPYPPFALVLSSELPSDTSRLPAYRLSHLKRFHPYARTRMPSSEKLAMDGDHRCDAPLPTLHRSSFALTADILENAEIEIEVDETSVRLVVQQQAHSRKFRVVVDYFAVGTFGSRLSFTRVNWRIQSTCLFFRHCSPLCATSLTVIKPLNFKPFCRRRTSASWIS